MTAGALERKRRFAMGKCLFLKMSRVLLTLVGLFSLCEHSSPALAGTSKGAKKSAPAANPAPESTVQQQTILVKELDKLPTATLTELAPGEGARKSFSGPLLRDVVRLMGNPTATKVVVRSADGKQVEFARDDWTKYDIILATKIDGKPLKVQSQGPVRIVFPYEAQKMGDRQAFDGKWLGNVSELKFVEMTIRLP